MNDSGTVLVHPYLDDGTKDVWDRGRCATCSLPKQNRSHQLPERSEEEKAVGARIVGESTAEAQKN